MKTLVLQILLLTFLYNYVYSLQQRVMLDITETQYLIDIYTQLDGENWEYNDWSKLEVGRLYDELNQIKSRGFSIVEDRDTNINDEIVKIYKIRLIDFSKIIGNSLIKDAEIPIVNFRRLSDILISNLYNCSGLNNFNMPNIESIKIYNSKVTGKLNLKEMNKLVYLETYKSNVDIDMSEINLPNCKSFVLYDAGVNSDFSIVNMDNVETFIIDSKYYFTDGVEYYMGVGNLNGNASELNKLKNAKTIIAYRTKLTGELERIDSPNLEIIELYGNKITGNLPTFKSTKLHTINLANNGFEGKFTLPINNSTKFIDVSENNLSGELNFNIEFDNLEVLKLNNNNFFGYIPKIVCDKLIHIDLSYNDFSGFRNDIDVNENTFFKIGYNKIPLNELISRCDLFPENREPFINHQTNPSSILREFKFLFHKYHLNYIGTDVIDDYFPIEHIQYGENNISFDFNTNKIIVNDYDTLYNYKVAYTTNPNESNFRLDFSIDINEWITKTGIYRVNTTSKYCDISRIDEINITQLSVIDNKDFFVYKNGNQLIIENTKKELFTNVQVYDLLGNLLYKTDNLNVNSTQIELQNINQPLLLKIYINNNWIVKKVL